MLQRLWPTFHYIQKISASESVVIPQNHFSLISKAAGCPIHFPQDQEGLWHPWSSYLLSQKHPQLDVRLASPLSTGRQYIPHLPISIYHGITLFLTKESSLSLHLGQTRKIQINICQWHAVLKYLKATCKTNPRSYAALLHVESTAIFCVIFPPLYPHEPAFSAD